ncbi:MAG: methionine--tRNA ligase [Chloroflexi bacterium RBG_16_57_8]|nr:MAG: methionine--tRNA ligase [Chloroflexi bacterium RBG_16_57_8]
MTMSVYVTTSIPYVNARPHVGHALELIQADVIARYHRLLSHSTRLQTGTDENAFKNVLSARAENISTQELVDRNSLLFQELAVALDISHDSFIRTTSDQHKRAVQRFWHRLKKGDIYVKRYRGLYCTGCEDFYLERDLVGGRCPDHGTQPAEVHEDNYFFRLSDYGDRLIELLGSSKLRIVPETRKNEVLSFVSRGLQDISISRPRERSGGWGIPVPGDPSQVVYVWIDALINYVSGLGYGDDDSVWRDYWGADTLKVHVIGKNVWKFHAVYWPALLMSTGLTLPDELVVHGFLTENGEKISKSKGSAIDPFATIKDYGTDAVRYYLLRGTSPFGDGDFSIPGLKRLYNSDLANGLGNLVSRVATLADRAKYGKHDCSTIPSAPDGYHESLGRYEFDNALKALWAIVTHLNQDIDRKRPWEALRKSNAPQMKAPLTEWLGELRRVACWLAPFLPAASAAILGVVSGDPITARPPLFPKVGLGT